MSLPPLLASEGLPDFGSADTVITSDELEMENSPDAKVFFFTGHVRIEGTNFIATCDEMQVFTRLADDAPSGDNANPIGVITRINADGNVHIQQSGREATSDQAIIHPNEEYLELIGRVHLEDANGTIEGAHLILEKNQRARMVGDGTKARPTVTLPALPDLGIKEELPPHATTPAETPIQPE